MNLTDASPRKWTKGCSFAWAIVSQVWVISPLKGIWMCFADKHTKSTKPGVKGYPRKEKLEKNPKNAKKPSEICQCTQNLLCGPEDALAVVFNDIVSQLPLHTNLEKAVIMAFGYQYYIYCFCGFWLLQVHWTQESGNCGKSTLSAVFPHHSKVVWVQIRVREWYCRISDTSITDLYEKIVIYRKYRDTGWLSKAIIN